jgi:phytoene synthase
VTPEQLDTCRRVIAEHSKSFALASRLLPPECRDDAAVVYAWCRHADDAVDLASASEQPRALAELRTELDAVYAGKPQTDPVLAAFQAVSGERGIPREYPEELLAGMEMDVVGTEYDSLDRLLQYCFRVAGTVGLMMCHVLGVQASHAVRHAAHLGMAMQLTNIARDVLEDWERGRLYIPDCILEECGAPDLRAGLGSPLPQAVREPLGRAVRRLLEEAERFYQSGDAGLPLLSWRSALSVRTARLVYSRIGERIERKSCDVFAGRMYVPAPAKLLLVARALAAAGAELPSRIRGGFSRVPLSNVVRFPADVLPV